PVAPEIADEDGVVGEVRVEGQHELAPGCREALTEGAAIAGRTLHEHARAEPAGEVGGPVARAAVDDQYLARAAEGGEDGVQAWGQRGDVVAFVEDGEDDGEI